MSTSEEPRGFVASLRNMELVAQHVRQGHSEGPWNRALTRQLAMLSEDNLPNREAVLNLQAMGRRHRYVYCGAPDPLRAVLPGVRTRVLGPPTLLQEEKIRQQRRRDETEFWHLQAEAASVGAAGRRPLFHKAPVYTRHTAPPDAQWFLDRLQETRGDQLLAIVRALDHAISNTSVILLLEAAGRKLLFPGDAQIENWSYALGRFAKYLHDVDLYKVGHHGSLNATPRGLWKLFTERGRARRPGRLVTLLSTLPGVHGDVSRGTEVPRRRLVSELERESTLFRTDRPGSAAIVVDMDLAARQGR